jgi:hypothetical protein
MAQAMAHTSGQLDGYCISRGRDVSEEALATLIDIMDGYVIPPLKLLRVAEHLKQRKNWTIPMVMTPYQLEAERICRQEAAGGRETFITPDQFKALLVEKIGTGPKCVQLDPKPERYAIYTEEAMTKLFAIAHRMVTEKMEARPRAFWLVPPELSLGNHEADW